MTHRVVGFEIWIKQLFSYDSSGKSTPAGVTRSRCVRPRLRHEAWLEARPAPRGRPASSPLCEKGRWSLRCPRVYLRTPLRPLVPPSVHAPMGPANARPHLCTLPGPRSRPLAPASPSDFQNQLVRVDGAPAGVRLSLRRPPDRLGRAESRRAWVSRPTSEAPAPTQPGLRLPSATCVGLSAPPFTASVRFASKSCVIFTPL